METSLQPKSKLGDLSSGYVPDVCIPEKYNAKNITMLYPMTEKVNQKIEHEKEIKFTSDDGVIVRVRFIDLFDIKKSLMGLIDL